MFSFQPVDPEQGGENQKKVMEGEQGHAVERGKG